MSACCGWIGKKHQTRSVFPLRFGIVAVDLVAFLKNTPQHGDKRLVTTLDHHKAWQKVLFQTTKGCLKFERQMPGLSAPKWRCTFRWFNFLNGCQDMPIVTWRVFFRWQAITEYGLRGQWREAVSILSDPWDPQQLGKNGRTRVQGAVGNETNHWTTGRKNPPFQARCFWDGSKKRRWRNLPSFGWFKQRFLKVGVFLRMVKEVFMGKVLQWMSWIV